MITRGIHTKTLERKTVFITDEHIKNEYADSTKIEQIGMEFMSENVY